jgi:S-DNA-T family DNA segregation ATPase FtsK/SpoIIIE
MAYQTRGRDPLLDSSMAEAIEKRGKELIGLALLALGAVMAAIVFSYHPDDPSWMSATDAPVRNWLGHMGASVAATLFMIIGWGGCGLAALAGAWGARLVLHVGEDRAVGRMIFAPIWLAALSIYAATLTPGSDWIAAHSYGLGGLFGDTALAALLGVMPFETGLSLKLASFVFGIAVVALGLFVLGASREELRTALRFLLVGVIMTYASLRAALGKGAQGAAQGAAHASMGLKAGLEARRERRAAMVEEERTSTAHALPREPQLSGAPRVNRAAPTESQPQAERGMGRVAPGLSAKRAAPDMAMPEQRHTDQDPAPEKPGGLMALMPSLMRRPEPEPEPELIDRTYHGIAPDAPAPDRVRAKIADVISKRDALRAQPPEASYPEDKPLTKGAVSGLHRLSCRLSRH